MNTCQHIVFPTTTLHVPKTLTGRERIQALKLQHYKKDNSFNFLLYLIAVQLFSTTIVSETKNQQKNNNM